MKGLGVKGEATTPASNRIFPSYLGSGTLRAPVFWGGVCFLSNSACLIRPHNALSLVYPAPRARPGAQGKHFAPGCRASRRAGRNRLAAPAQWARGARFPRRPLVDGFCAPSSLPCPPPGPSLAIPLLPRDSGPLAEVSRCPHVFVVVSDPQASCKDEGSTKSLSGGRDTEATSPYARPREFKAAARDVPIKESGGGFRRRQCHCDFPNMWSLGQCLYL